MARPITEILYGERAGENSPTCYRRDTIRLQGMAGGQPAWFSIGTEELSTGLLCIGGTGSGKTNAMQSMVSQIRSEMTEQDVMLIFDAKGDYRRAFYQYGQDEVLGTAGSTATWNLFREALADGYGRAAELNILEICRSLFQPYESSQQPFFANAARGLFAAFLTSCVRQAETDPIYARQRLNNRRISDFFGNPTIESFRRLAKQPGLGYVDLYLGKNDSNQAMGVLAELLVMVQDCFFGPFGESGDFSAREFVRSRGGRALFVEYDLTIGGALSPVYGLIIDMALKEVLGRQGQNGGNVYVILDEFRLLPKLSHLEDAVNYGRSMGVKLMAGVQAISQLYELYGEEHAKSLTAGFGSMIAFRPNDAGTRQFVTEYFGDNLLSETIYVGGMPDSRRRDGHCVEDWELRELLPGEAFVSVSHRAPYRYRFPAFGGR